MNEEHGIAIPDETGADALVANLQEALAFEQMKNQFLVEKLIEAEDGLAKKDLSEFSDVVPDEDVDFWADRLVSNREATLAALGRLRNRVAESNVSAAVGTGEKVGADGSAAVPLAGKTAQVAPKPLHNRAVAKPEALVEPSGNAPSARLARVTSRAKDLVRNRRVAFDVAWRIAEAELKEGE